MADDIKIVGLSSKKPSTTNWKIIGAIIGIIVLSVGVIAGIMLVGQDQDIREKAAECSNGGGQCPDPSNPSLLRDCSTTGETFPNDSVCNAAGRIEVCGTNSSNARQYCCPSAGAAWTTNLTLCPVATPTVTATATATSTGTARASATATSTSSSSATATATSTSSGSNKTATPTSTSKSTSTSKASTTPKASSTATAFPVPETGADLPTMIGVGFGVVMLLVSLALAL